MIWMDYTIESGVDKFRVKGDSESELLDKGLYKPGEVYIVGNDGWLYKTDQLSLLVQKYKEGKNNDSRVSDSN